MDISMNTRFSLILHVKLEDGSIAFLFYFFLKLWSRLSQKPGLSCLLYISSYV